MAQEALRQFYTEDTDQETLQGKLPYASVLATAAREEDDEPLQQPKYELSAIHPSEQNSNLVMDTYMWIEVPNKGLQGVKESLQLFLRQIPAERFPGVEITVRYSDGSHNTAVDGLNIQRLPRAKFEALVQNIIGEKST